MIVLITDNLYLRAEKVQSISVTEQVLWDGDEDGNSPDRKIVTYSIAIEYEPAGQQQQNHNSVMHINLTARNRKHCNETMKALIEQVRQQDPDNLMLDKLIDKYFCGEVKEYDRRPKKIRRVRKAKRRNKKVSRRS
jgi:hypothetical protein